MNMLFIIVILMLIDVGLVYLYPSLLFLGSLPIAVLYSALGLVNVITVVYCMDE